MLTQEQLNRFEEKLLIKKEKILKNLAETERDINDVRNSELNDEGDYAAASVETAVDSAILEQQYRELREIELSLGKIKNGMYGICEMCEEPIGIERLEVKNFARFCITCREINEKNK
ncbi:MAG: RNA polymerase-binding protein DksA [Campylobacterales bacterium]|nr:RNA polymerase-binding protein DksA [Campylobacterales bacterium]